MLNFQKIESDGQKLADWIYSAGYESPADFVRDKTGKKTREEFNSEYMFLNRIIKLQTISKKNLKRLRDEFGISEAEISTITGGKNKASGGSQIATTHGTINKFDDSKIKELEQQIEYWRNKYISLLEKQAKK